MSGLGESVARAEAQAERTLAAADRALAAAERLVKARAAVEQARGAHRAEQATRLRELEDSAERASLAHWRAAEWARLAGQYDRWRVALAAARVASVVVMARWSRAAKLA
jgi:hypothetical protein